MPGGWVVAGWCVFGMVLPAGGAAAEPSYACAASESLDAAPVGDDPTLSCIDDSDCASRPADPVDPLAKAPRDRPAAPQLSSAFDPELPIGVGAGGPHAAGLEGLGRTPESEPEASPEPPPIFSPLPAGAALSPTPQLIGSHLVLHLMRPPRNGQLLVVALYPALDCNGPMQVQWQNKVATSFAVRDGWSHALLPVSVTTHPGHYPLRVRCGAYEAAFHLNVLAAPYPESRLVVAPKFTLAPPHRVVAEQQAIEYALSHGRRERQWTQPFVFPTAGNTTSPYGVRRTFNGKLKSRHLGEDFHGKIGDPVWATNDGVVALSARDFFFTGNALFIDHGQNVFSMYFHLSEVHVHTGDRVLRGQQIGAVGGSGRVTGPHMHFGIKMDGTYIDPSDLLNYDPLTPLGPPL